MKVTCYQLLSAYSLEKNPRETSAAYAFHSSGSMSFVPLGVSSSLVSPSCNLLHVDGFPSRWWSSGDPRWFTAEGANNDWILAEILARKRKMEADSGEVTSKEIEWGTGVAMLDRGWMRAGRWFTVENIAETLKDEGKSQNRTLLG